MEPLQLVIAVGLITGGFTLAGVVIGPWLKARGDDKHWRRQLRVDTYADLYRAVIELLIAGANAENHQPDDETTESRLHDFFRTLARVRLVAPPGVREACQDLSAELDRAFHDPKHRNRDEWADEVYVLLEAFEEAARGDLGIERGTALRRRLSRR